MMQRKLMAAGVDSETAEFPFAELVVALGFFLVLIIEQCVNQCQKIKKPVGRRGGGAMKGRGGGGEEKEKGGGELSSNNNQLFLEHHEDHQNCDGGGGTLLRASLLIIALSVHSLLEGTREKKKLDAVYSV